MLKIYNIGRYSPTELTNNATTDMINISNPLSWYCAVNDKIMTRQSRIISLDRKYVVRFDGVNKTDCS